MSTKPKLLIGTPMFGGSCSGIYTLSLIGFINACHRNNIDFELRAIANESLIQRARNMIVNKFLSTDCTHLIFIDADIGFDGNDILSMVAADKDIIGGPYPKKGIDWSRVVKAVKAGVPAEKLNDYASSGYVVNALSSDVPKNATEPMEIDHVGTGFMLIKRHVFETLIDKVPRFKIDSDADDWHHEFFAASIHPEREVLLSEDYHFCALWRKYGGQVFVAPWVKLAHIGIHVFTGAGMPGS